MPSSKPSRVIAPTQRVFLVRHGLASLNAEGRLRGQATRPWTRSAGAEAAALAAVLSADHVVKGVTSPLLRALQDRRGDRRRHRRTDRPRLAGWSTATTATGPERWRPTWSDSGGEFDQSPGAGECRICPPPQPVSAGGSRSAARRGQCGFRDPRRGPSRAAERSWRRPRRRGNPTANRLLESDLTTPERVDG